MSCPVCSRFCRNSASKPELFHRNNWCLWLNSFTDRHVPRLQRTHFLTPQIKLLLVQTVTEAAAAAIQKIVHLLQSKLHGTLTVQSSGAGWEYHHLHTLTHTRENLPPKVPKPRGHSPQEGLRTPSIPGRFFGHVLIQGATLLTAKPAAARRSSSGPLCQGFFYTLVSVSWGRSPEVGVSTEAPNGAQTSRSKVMTLRTS